MLFCIIFHLRGELGFYFQTKWNFMSGVFKLLRRTRCFPPPSVSSGDKKLK